MTVSIFTTTNIGYMRKTILQDYKFVKFGSVKNILMKLVFFSHKMACSETNTLMVAQRPTESVDEKIMEIVGRAGSIPHHLNTKSSSGRLRYLPPTVVCSGGVCIFLK